MADMAKEVLWKERMAQWRASGLSQRAYAKQNGLEQRQLSYWVRRLESNAALPAMLPIRVASLPAATSAISLRNEQGWTLVLPLEVPVAWLAELMRAL